MNIKVNLSREKKLLDIQLENGSTVENLLKKLKLKPDTIITMTKEKVIPIDDILENNQEIMIIQVSSGG